MKRALLFSILLHVSIMVVLFAAPIWRNKPLAIEDHVMIVELQPIKEKDNIKTAQPKAEDKKQEVENTPPPAAKKEQPKEITENIKAQPEKKESKAEYLPQKKVEAKPKIKPEEKEKIANKISHVKPSTKPKPPVRDVAEKEKKKQPDFNSVLSSIEEISQKYQQEKEEKNKQQAQRFNSEQPLSMTLISSIRKQISDYWNIDGGARYAENIVVKLHITLEQDGSVIKVKVDDESRYTQDSFYKAAADRAITAIYRVSKFKGLPTDQYQQWKYIVLTFDPSKMFE